MILSEDVETHISIRIALELASESGKMSIQFGWNANVGDQPNAVTDTRLYTQKLSQSFNRAYLFHRVCHRAALAQRSIVTQKLLHRDTFTHKGFYIQAPLHTDVLRTEAPTPLHRKAFTEKNPYPQMQREAFVHNTVLAQRRLYKQKLLHRDVLRQKSFSAKKCLQTEAFTERTLYVEKLLHREAFEQTTFGQNIFTHKSFYT